MIGGMEEYKMMWAGLIIITILGFSCIGLSLWCFFWGIEVGRKSALGIAQGPFAPKREPLYQAPDPGQAPAPAPGGTKNPLRDLDNVIERALGDIHFRRGQQAPQNLASLLDPELAGLAPTQARDGGES